MSIETWLAFILAASATLYTILKCFGVCYLIYLGIKAFTEKPSEDTNLIEKMNVPKFKMFRDSSIVTALNPKNIVFFVAFFPQFVNTSVEVFPQFLILMFSFSLITLMTITSFAMFAGSVEHRIRSYRAKKRLNQVGGTALIGAGVFTATMQKN